MKEGRVTSVFTQGGSVYCNVSLLNTHNSDLQRVQVAQPAGGFLAVPSVGDDVLVTTTEDGDRYITHVLSEEPAAYPDLGEGELTLRFGDDGELTISEGAEGYELHLNGATISLGSGGSGAITDLDVSTADGYVTSVSPVRSDKVDIE